MSLLSTLAAGVKRGGIPLAISSSAIGAASYNPETLTLSVTFNNGRTYTHPGISPATAAAFEAAPSAGAYYDAVLRSHY